MANKSPGPKQALLCPNCGKLVSADDSACPYCGLSTPGSRWKNIILGRTLFKGDRLIRAIITVSVAMYILSLLVSRHGVQLTLNPLHALAPDYQGLIRLGATGTIPIDRFNRWWTLVSATYLHGGILHIAFNMLAFRQIAPLVNREYGSHRMLAIYTLSGCGGFLVSYAAGIHLTIGASAAVCGLIGAALYYGKSRGGIYGQAIYRQVSGWVLGIILFGVIVPGINNWAHGGGIAAGIGLGVVLGYREQREETFIHRVLGRLCLFTTAGVLLWTTARGLMAAVI